MMLPLSMKQTPKYHQTILTFGGGTGHYYLIRGLVDQNEPSLIYSVPSGWDDGGSTRRLRVEMGVLPPGDFRRCVIAMMEDEEQRLVAQKLFNDRFADFNGPLQGHSMGNLILAQLERIYQGQDRGINAAKKLFLIKGHILPVTLTNLILNAQTESGIEIEGETNIDYRAKRVDFKPEDRIARIFFDTKAEANPEVLEAISKAEKIIFSSGDLYTSVVPHLIVNGIQKAILKSKAQVVLVLNLMTKPGETDFFKASDFLKVFSYYLGDRLDFLVCNKNHLNKEVLEAYKKAGQEPVEIDKEKCLKVAPKVKIIEGQFAQYLKEEHLLRHDSHKLASTILKI